MTALAAIWSALKPLGLPMHPHLYEGTEDRYITYNYTDDRGADYGDDVPDCNLVSVQVHYVAPLDESPTQMKQAIRSALFAAGFTYPVIIDQSDAQNTVERKSSLTHLIFECEYLETRM